MGRLQLVVALVFTAFVGAPAAGQSAPGPPAVAAEGISYRGRQIGFQPRHLRPAAVAPDAAGHRVLPHRPASTPHRPVSAVAAGRLSSGDPAARSPAPTPPATQSIVVPPGRVQWPEGDALPVEGLPETVIGDVGEEYGWDSMGDGMAMEAWQPAAGSLLWARGEYLLWWTQGMSVPALATSSPSGTAQEDGGVLGREGTSILFGGENLLDDSRSGGRVTLGLWLDPCRQSGIEFTYLGLGEESASFAASSGQFDILARPFAELQAGNSDSRLIVFPELIEGTLGIEVTSEFQSAEVLFRRPLMGAECTAVDFFVGYRFAELDDAVRITESTASLAEPTTGTRFQLDDRFESSNEFHGGQVAIHLLGQRSPAWSTELTGKFSLGSTTSRVAISGQTVVTPVGGASTTQPAGLLVQQSNSGVFESDELSTLSELGMKIRRHLGCGLSVSVGYQILVWTDVMRAGEQIDTTINVSQIPPGTLVGPGRPTFPGELTDFWAQGLNFGLDYCY